MSEDESRTPEIGLGRIFRAFLLLGATSFGGGVVAYLREALVVREKWLDDETFIQGLELLQTTWRLAQPVVRDAFDVGIVLATFAAVAVLHLPLLAVLSTVAPFAVWWYRPVGNAARPEGAVTEEPAGRHDSARDVDGR